MRQGVFFKISFEAQIIKPQNWPVDRYKGNDFYKPFEQFGGLDLRSGPFSI